MTLNQRISALAQGIAADIKAILTNQGNLTNLSTSDTSSLVNAINEIFNSVGDAYEIDDAALGTNASKTYSAQKIMQLLAQTRSDLLGGASSAFDTLKELQDAIGSDGTAISGLLTAVGNKVDYSQVQSLSSGQKLQACNNIGIGDPDHNFLADYTTARDE